MGRKFLMLLLGAGAVAGFSAGFAHLCRFDAGHYGPGGRFGHHAEFEQRVAETCTEAALRVYNKQGPAAGQKP